MSVKIVSNNKTLKRITPIWEKLYKELEYVTPYQDWVWNYLYWKYFKGDKKLKIFVYGSEDTADAIFPMWIREQLGLSVLEPIGTRGTDYIHLLLKTNAAVEAIDKFFEWFSRSQLDVINLEDLPHTAFYIDALKKSTEKYGLYYSFNDKYCPCFEIDLSNGWENYLRP